MTRRLFHLGRKTIKVYVGTRLYDDAAKKAGAKGLSAWIREILEKAVYGGH